MCERPALLNMWVESHRCCRYCKMHLLQLLARITEAHFDLILKQMLRSQGMSTAPLKRFPGEPSVFREQRRLLQYMFRAMPLKEIAIFLVAKLSDRAWQYLKPKTIKQLIASAVRVSQSLVQEHTTTASSTAARAKLPESVLPVLDPPVQWSFSGVE